MHAPLPPDRVGGGRECRGVVRLGVPAGGVEVEALLDAGGAVAQLGRQGRGELEPRRGDLCAEAQLLRGTGQAGEEQRVGLVLGQAGQPGAVALDEPVAAGVPGLAVERDAGREQRVDVAVDRADGNLQLGGQLCGREPAPGLEQEQQLDDPGGAHELY